MASKLFDITLPMSNALANWPGDAPFRFEWTCRKADGESVNVGQVSMSVHTGTHTDAPFHFSDAGPTAEKLSLESFIGPARVLDLRGRATICQQDLERFDLSQTPRVLLRTGAWLDHSRFLDTIPTLTPDAPDWLASQGVILVGVDVPSVDAIDSKDLPIHHALGLQRIAILESLNLADVPEGVYELIALPLKLVGADGAPVRAILRSCG
jgi:arylformamidase